MKPVSCGVLVLQRNGRLLLGHASGSRWWDIPKGMPEAGESPREAALREAEEETGLRLEPCTLHEIGRFAYRPQKDLHLFATGVAPFPATDCRCRSHFRDRHGAWVPEFARFAWVAPEHLDRHCAPRMAALLQTLPLAELAARLAPSAAPTGSV